MSPESLDRIELLFQAVSALDPENRSLFLDTYCGDDQELRDELESLLKADQDAEDENYMAAPLAPPSEIDLIRESTKEADDRLHIGPYTIVRNLGQGGMGDVYLAMQTTPFKRYVALKIIRRGMDFGAVLQRFDMERQILASLNHPNIARLIDGGATADGTPYFAMEYVEGMTITSYCTINACTIDERLNLFLSVCNAVHHAHQNLILHRDLKPSNVLVTQKGEVKLLDFGIAKLLNPGLSPQMAPVTQFDRKLMTPDYASPEQVRGISLSTASDVYSLGVILYELLTGHQPYYLKRRTTEELLKIVCEQDPERPSLKIRRTTRIKRVDQEDTVITPGIVSKSRRVSTEKLQKILRGDLDHIVMKALRKEPGLRYAGPRQLAKDIERYMKGLPIEAQQGNRSYRLKKFVKRYRVETTAVFLVVLSMAIGMASTLWQANVASRERDAAQEALEIASLELRKSDSVTSFMLDLFQATDPHESEGDTITAEQLLQRGLQRVEALEEQPNVQAQLLDVIGVIYQRLSRGSAAKELHERAYQLRLQHLDQTHSDIGVSLFHLGDVYLSLGQPNIAEEYLYKAIAHQQRYNPNNSVVLAESMMELAYVYFEQSRYEEAEKYVQEAIDTYRLNTPQDSAYIVEAFNLLGRTNLHQWQTDETASLYESVLLFHQKGSGISKLHVSDTMNNLGLLLRRRGDYDRAEQYLVNALALSLQVVGKNTIDEGIGLHNLGTLYYYKGQLDRAGDYFTRALAIYDLIFPEEHAQKGITQHNYARVLRDQGQYDQAESLLAETYAMQQRLFPNDHFHKSFTIHTLGVLYLQTERYDQAREYLERAMSMRERLIGKDHPDYGRTLQRIAHLELELGNEQQARELLFESQRIYEGEILDTHLWARDLAIDLERMGIR